jgi:hypothetical protein
MTGYGWLVFWGYPISHQDYILVFSILDSIWRVYTFTYSLCMMKLETWSWSHHGTGFGVIIFSFLGVMVNWLCVGYFLLYQVYSLEKKVPSLKKGIMVLLKKETSWMKLIRYLLAFFRLWWNRSYACCLVSKKVIVCSMQVDTFWSRDWIRYNLLILVVNVLCRMIELLTFKCPFVVHMRL